MLCNSGVEEKTSLNSNQKSQLDWTWRLEGFFDMFMIWSAPGIIRFWNKSSLVIVSRCHIVQCKESMAWLNLVFSMTLLNTYLFSPIPAAFPNLLLGRIFKDACFTIANGYDISTSFSVSNFEKLLIIYFELNKNELDRYHRYCKSK